MRKNKIALIIAIAASILVSLQVFKLNIGQNLVPKKVKESIEQGELLIETTSDNIDAIHVLLRNYKGQMDRAFHPKTKGTTLDDYYLIDIPDNIADKKDELLNILRQEDLIDYGEFNDVIQLHPLAGKLKKSTLQTTAVNDPLVNDQWAFTLLHMNDWYKLLIENHNFAVKTIKVAVLDTGVDAAHEDIRNMLAKKD